MPIHLIDQDHGFSRTLGLRIGKFAYCTDVVALDAVAMDTLRGVEVLIVDCFQRQPHRTHARPSIVLDWVRELRPARTILTHMGPDMDWAWMQRTLPGGIEAGYDGLVIDLPD